MRFETIATEELIRIAHAGLGFKLSVTSKSLDDLIRIADAAKDKSAKITFTGFDHLSDYDIKRIEMASQGHVSFEH
ncbi:MAG: hypothetical protein ACTS9Y_07945 [Methylophilus sp.]|uniref:hypothetical protein n=1 Tax=Methylophilus sp. TaxID=29541 RepID=UPI003F9FA60F